MSNTWRPLYPKGRIVPVHPYENMPPDVAELWTYFSETLGWGVRIHARAVFDFLIHARAFAKGRTILDAGAGQQRYRRFFSESTYLSQEHSPGIAMKQMEATSYDFIKPLDEEIPLSDSSVNCVLNTVVLEHIRFPERFLAEVFRVLTAGGRLYLQAPFNYVEHEQPYDFNRPTRYALTAWLQTAGFEKICVLPNSNSCYGSAWYFAESFNRELALRGKEDLLNALLPIIQHCHDAAFNATDDFIDPETPMPVGWIAVAEKD